MFRKRAYKTDVSLNIHLDQTEVIIFDKVHYNFLVVKYKLMPTVRFNHLVGSLCIHTKIINCIVDKTSDFVPSSSLSTTKNVLPYAFLPDMLHVIINSCSIRSCVCRIAPILTIMFYGCKLVTFCRYKWLGKKIRCK